MTERVARDQTLYTQPSSPGGVPALRGGRCDACGYVFFPPHTYGCESCGAGPERIEPALLPGEGTLRTFATVHQQRGLEGQVPFVVGVVRLDAGPELEAILVCSDESELVIGSRVHATLESADDCRFAPTTERAEA
jgi:uncharacterized OB-fold protein